MKPRIKRCIRPYGHAVAAVALAMPAKFALEQTWLERACFRIDIRDDGTQGSAMRGVDSLGLCDRRQEERKVAASSVAAGAPRRP